MNLDLITLATGALVGGAIGAGTNYLAIRCIFWFIIPGKKAQLAQAVQEAVSRELMSPAKLRGKMLSPQVADLIRGNIEQFLDSYLERDLGSLQELAGEHQESLEEFRAQVSARLREELLRRLTSDDFREQILEPFLLRSLEHYWRTPLAAWLPLPAQHLAQLAGSALSQGLASPAWRQQAARALARVLHQHLDQQQRLDRILPAPVVELVLGSLRSQVPFLVSHLANLLAQPESQWELSASFKQIVEAQLRKEGALVRLVARQFDLDSRIERLCADLPQRVSQYFSQADNLARVEELILGTVREWLAREIGDTGLLPDPQTLAQSLEEFMGGLAKPQLAQEWGQALAAWLETQAQEAPSVWAVRLGVSLDLKEAAANLGRRVQEALSSASAEEMLAGQLDRFIAELCTRPLGRLSRLVSPAIRALVAELVEAQVLELARTRLEEFTERSGLWDTVSESIRNYDNKEIERMVRAIAQRELTWVTLTGLILGGLVGGLQALLIPWLKTLGW